MIDQIETCEGGCSCGDVRYKMGTKPLIVHCCHCSRCQRQTGTAFALNALIEADRVELLQGEIESTMVETPGGSGQRIARCPKCKVAVWSEYLVTKRGFSDFMYFIRVGTLDSAEHLPPDVHIHTSAKQPWVVLPPGSRAFEKSYIFEETWSEDSLARNEVLEARIEEYASKIDPK